MKMFDTIAAIATPIGSGGVAIIRVSGENAESAAQSVVSLRCGKPLKEAENRRLYLADAHKAGDKSAVLDEALVSVMRAPHSYTGETVVEINCHGGWLAADSILKEILASDARLAEAGEFTRRAFVNGKTDLIGAEAVMDIIDSNSGLGLSNAAKSRGGALSRKIDAAREGILAITAEIAAAADYPEEVDPLPADETAALIGAAAKRIDELIAGFETGKILRDGIAAVIAGRPNVGKSSLMNALTRSDRAIVTSIPGTTRDTVEGVINIKGAAMRLLDTAGIRGETDDEIERIGIDRALKWIDKADLCIFVADSSEALTGEDMRIIETLKGKICVCALNKTDISAKARLTKKELAEKTGIDIADIIETAAPENGEARGIEALESRIADKFALGKISGSDVYVSNARQRDSLIKARKALGLALEGAQNGAPFDLLYIDLEDALSALGEVTGMTVQEEIIDNVFSRFCVGK